MTEPTTKCRCGRDAVVHVTETLGGFSKTQHGCEACAARAVAKAAAKDPGLDLPELGERVLVADLETGAIGCPGLASGDSSQPAWSPDSRRIAFAQIDDGNCHIAGA